jgi:hypothetical protein
MNRLIALAKRAPPACSSIRRPTFARLAGSSGAGCRARAGGDAVGEQLRAHLGWGLSRPATEGVGERACFLEPKQPGHLRNRKLGICEVPQGTGEPGERGTPDS